MTTQACVLQGVQTEVPKRFSGKAGEGPDADKGMQYTVDALRFLVDQAGVSVAGKPPRATWGWSRYVSFVI